MEKMDNSVDSILGMMEGILETAKVFPMSHGRVLVDQEQFLDMLADLRTQLPVSWRMPEESLLTATTFLRPQRRKRR